MESAIGGLMSSVDYGVFTSKYYSPGYNSLG